jgi:long-chain acyl-CoA synthetase
MPQELLGELVREGKNRTPSRLALVWRDQEISYLTLDGQIDRVASSLQRLKVQPADRIALYLHNLPHFVVAFFALQRIGAVPVPLNIYWKSRDLRYLLEESRVSGVITIAPYYDRFKELTPLLPEINWIVAITAGGAQPSGSIAWEELLAEPLSEAVYEELDAVDPALLAFTAGRTGPSRPVLLSHFNLLANCQQMQDLAQVQFLGGWESEARLEKSSMLPRASAFEVALLPLPLFNLFNLNIGLNLTTFLGGTVVLMERFDPAQALELVGQHECTLIFGSPAIFSQLVNASDFAGANLESLRAAFSYGGPLTAEVKAAWLRKTGSPIFNCYGVTEASPLLCCEAAGAQSGEDSVGPPLPIVQLSLQGPGGAILPPDQAGELMAKGPNMMLGYFNPAEPDKPHLVKTEGWFPTGDMAVADEDGNFHIIDRKEDILVLPKGDLLAPRDIERILESHPGVWSAAALPYTAPDGRNRMIAFVVLNHAGRNLTEPLLVHYCDRRLPASHCPERIFIYQELDFPRLPNGAVWRRALRAQIPEYL